MRCLSDTHETNAYVSVRMIQFKNGWSDLEEI
jgi:hypothetical protein